MKKIIIYTIIMVVLITCAYAKPQDNNETEGYDCGNQGFDCECQNFYNDSDYRAVAKWVFENDDYEIDEQNPAYSYIHTDVTGDLKSANWTSNNTVYSLLVKAGNDQEEFDGGTQGWVYSSKDISHITFCKYVHTNGGGGCANGNCNGVPEFSTLTFGAAIMIGAMGLIYLRKK